MNYLLAFTIPCRLLSYIYVHPIEYLFLLGYPIDISFVEYHLEYFLECVIKKSLYMILPVYPICNLENPFWGAAQRPYRSEFVYRGNQKEPKFLAAY